MVGLAVRPSLPPKVSGHGNGSGRGDEDRKIAEGEVDRLDRPVTSQTMVEPAPSLSAQLRAQTAPLHARIETLLGLPASIRSREDYLLWLGRFLGFYEPLERALAAFPGWEAFGCALPARTQAPCLANDLGALAADPRQPPRIASELLPALPSFSHALGAAYVLEGATLGGRIILRDLEPRMGAALAGATRFFGGRGKATGPMWQSFQAALDAFGRAHPGRCADVVTGAQRTFRALLAWFAPFCAVPLRAAPSRVTRPRQA